MNCEKCGIKISPSVARQQEGGENLCRDCFCWKRAREQEEQLQREQRLHKAATEAANQIKAEKEEGRAGDLIESMILNEWKRQGGIHKQAAEAYEKDEALRKQAEAELEEELLERREK